jgi:ATP-dependent RNA helicase DBP3
VTQVGEKQRKGKAVTAMVALGNMVAAEPALQEKKAKKKDKKKREREDAEVSEAAAPVVEEKKKKKNKNKEVEVAAEEAVMEKKKKKKQKNEEASPLVSGTKSSAAVTAQVAGNEELSVVVTGTGSQDPKFIKLETFNLDGVPATVLQCCQGFQKPSPIQAHAWPFLLAGRDLVGIAATGSGKTLAFGIPAMKHVLDKMETMKSKSGPICLVLAPTRELAQQIADVLEESGGACGVSTVCVYGGTPKGPQRSALKAGARVVIATPGRLQDLMEEGVCSLDYVTYVVLDEADRMLDLGFEPAIRAILSTCAKVRQTVMFSATWPQAVSKLAMEFMNEGEPVKVMVGSQDLAANHDVTQIVEVIEDRARDARLETLLQKYHKSRTNRVLVFVLYKKEAVRVETALQRRGWKVSAVHGDKGQADRTKAVNSFKDGSRPLLIATDVAARGLDIPDVEYVINYSFPLTTEDYVHRIGRTGRAGKKGLSHTFFTQADRARAGELVNVLREAGQIVPEELLKFGTHVKKKESKLYGAHFKEIGADSGKAKKITFGDSDDE